MVYSDWPLDIKLVGYMMAALLGVAGLTGVFATVIALLCRVLVVAVFVRPLAEIPGAIFAIRVTGLPPWLSIGMPILTTLAIFVGLPLLNHWQRGLFTQRLESATREPPAELRQRVTRLSKVADMRPPSVAMIESDNATAFTTGMRPGTAQITVTSALLETLSDSELNAVIAHELSHIKNRDIPVMTMVMVPIVVAAGLWTVMTSDPDRRGERRRSGFRFEGVITGLFGGIAGVFWPLACLSVAPFARYRELAADRGAAVITGEPGTLAMALERMDGRTVPATDLRLVGVSPLAILPVSDTAAAWTGGWETPTEWLPIPIRERVSVSARTHPATTTRIRRLQAAQSEL